MCAKYLREETGYSLVEVMVSILIMAIAILPMMGMFDTGLQAASTGSNYDKARMLANANLEKVQALSYANARATYTPVNATPTPGDPVSCDQDIFSPPRGNCEVTTTYVDESYLPDASFTTQMQVVVTVEWDGSSYTTTGLKAR